MLTSFRYTSAWDAKYAVNTVSYDDAIGAKYTYSDSLFYSKSSIQPICPSDISYLQTSGSDFCSAYISYSPSTTTVSTTITPSQFVTVTTTDSTSTITATATKIGLVWKRGDNGTATNETLSTATGFSTVTDLPSNSIAILTQTQTATMSLNVSTTAGDSFAKRALATPASISNWPSYKISAACSQVATGQTTLTATSTANSMTTTIHATQTSAATCDVPVELSLYSSWDSIYGTWDSTNGQPGASPQAYHGDSSLLQLPFDICMYGTCSSLITVGTDGTISFSDITLSVYSNLGQGLYIYNGGTNGLYYRITGSNGSRQLTFAWYAATYNWGHQATHVMATYFEASPNQIQYKYYDAIQDAPYNSIPSVYVQKGTSTTWVVDQGDQVTVGSQFTIKTGTDATVLSVSKTMHDRIDCCTKANWHSCTEFTGADSTK